MFFFQATQADDPDRFTEATIKLYVQPNNLSPPSVTIENNGQGYIYENSEAGLNVFKEVSPEHSTMMIVVTDPDAVS